METNDISCPAGDLEETKTSQVDEWVWISFQNKDIVEFINSSYNAIEFRVDMFLHKLWSIWTKPEYLHNKVTKFYVGKEIPQSQIDSSNITDNNIEYYKDWIARAISIMRMMWNIPIIYTVRSKQDGGVIDTSISYALYNNLVLFGATKIKCDIIDIEFHYEQNISEIKKIINSCTNSLVLVSKHSIHNEWIFDHQQLVYSLKVHENSFDTKVNNRWKDNIKYNL